VNLFQQKEFFMHSGEFTTFKIECDALTDEDIETVAYLISKKFNFNRVQGIAKGGTRLGIALQKYCIEDSKNSLIVDDVLTTGSSMKDARYSMWAVYPGGERVIGVVIFARGKCPDWITPIFQIWDYEEEI